MYIAQKIRTLTISRSRKSHTSVTRDDISQVKQILNRMSKHVRQAA